MPCAAGADDVRYLSLLAQKSSSEEFSTMTSFNSGPSDDHVGGPLNLFGVLPGQALQYEGKAMPHVIHFDVSFESSHDEIDRLVLLLLLLVVWCLLSFVFVFFFFFVVCFGLVGW